MLAVLWIEAIVIATFAAGLTSREPSTAPGGARDGFCFGQREPDLGLCACGRGERPLIAGFASETSRASRLESNPKMSHHVIQKCSGSLWIV